MQTRSTSWSKARTRTTILAFYVGVVLIDGCKDEPTPPVQTDCRPNQFRECEAECGRGVEQCVEPGLWNGCVCVVLDASLPDRRPGPEAGGATDASGDSGDREAGDATGDAAEGGSDAADSDALDPGPG
jgi:hypothetical protein